MSLVRSRSIVLAVALLTAGLGTACVSVGSSEACVAGVEYDGTLYVEQNTQTAWSDPALGTAVQRFCDDSRQSHDDVEESFDIHRLGSVDPKYAFLVVHADGAGIRESSGAVFTLPQDEVPAGVWVQIQSLAG